MIAGSAGCATGSSSSSKPPRLYNGGRQAYQGGVGSHSAGPLPPSCLAPSSTAPIMHGLLRSGSLPPACPLAGSSPQTTQRLLSPASSPWFWEATGATALSLAASGAQSPHLANWQYSNRSQECSIWAATRWADLSSKLGQHHSRGILLQALHSTEGRWSPLPAKQSDSQGKSGRWRSKFAGKQACSDRVPCELETGLSVNSLAESGYTTPMRSQARSKMSSGGHLDRLPATPCRSLGRPSLQSRSSPMEEDRERNLDRPSGAPTVPTSKIVIKSSTPRFNNGSSAPAGRALAYLASSRNSETTSQVSGGASPQPSPPSKLAAPWTAQHRPHAEGVELGAKLGFDEALAQELFRRFGLDECMTFDKFKHMHGLHP